MLMPKELLEAARQTPGYGSSWWAPEREAFVCRHFGDDVKLELETDTRRERATQVFLSLGKLP